MTKVLLNERRLESVKASRYGGVRRKEIPGPSGGQREDVYKRQLYRNASRTIKIFLHLSKDEQRKRFLERIDAPDKNWKLSAADLHERKFWDHYRKAYEECLNATSTHHAPWYVVPADDKDNARLIVSQIVLDALNELKMAYPKTSAKRRLELKSIRDLLTDHKG